MSDQASHTVRCDRPDPCSMMNRHAASFDSAPPTDHLHLHCGFEAPHAAAMERCRERAPCGRPGQITSCSGPDCGRLRPTLSRPGAGWSACALITPRGARCGRQSGAVLQGQRFMTTTPPILRQRRRRSTSRVGCPLRAGRSDGITLHCRAGELQIMERAEATRPQLASAMPGTAVVAVLIEHLPVPGGSQSLGQGCHVCGSA